MSHWHKSISSKNEGTYGVLLCKFTIFNAFEKLWYRKPLDVRDLGGVSFHLCMMICRKFFIQCTLNPNIYKYFISSVEKTMKILVSNEIQDSLNVVMWRMNRWTLSHVVQHHLMFSSLPCQRVLNASKREFYESSKLSGQYNDGTKPCKRYFVTIWMFHYLFNNACFKSVEWNASRNSKDFFLFLNMVQMESKMRAPE